jgi:hypothetical protein
MRPESPTRPVYAVALLILCSLTPAQLLAAWNQKAKIDAADAAEYDQFAMAVAVCADYAIVGSRYDDDNGFNSGSAYIFKWDGNYWTQYDKLTPSDATPNQKFGYSVSITDDYAIVGALGDGSTPGAAYVFKKGGGGWGQVARLTASDGVASDQFGISVSICRGPISNGDYALVGAYWDDDNGNDSGSVYVFDAPGGSWTDRTEFFKLIAPDGSQNDHFGYSVAGDAYYAVVGSQFSDQAGLTDSGAVYIYQFGDTGWQYQATLTASDAQPGDWLGYSAAMSADYVVAGAPGNDDNGGQTGSAYVFKRNGTTWTEQAKLLAHDGAANDWFGYSVAICPYYCIVGASMHDGAASDTGAAYVFRSRNAAWTHLTTLTASDAAEMDAFGCSVSIDGRWALVGAYMEDFGANSTGSAYVFEHTCPTADLTDNCWVEYNDVTILGDFWLQTGCGTSNDCPPDLDGSGTVDLGDLVVLASQWLAYN